MKVKSNFKFISSIASAIFIIIVLINSKIVTISIIESLNICFNILIPSIFFFLIICDFFQRTNALKFVLKPLEPIFESLFKVDKNLTSTLFFSLICGYPTGAYLIANLLRAKQISNKTASRLLCFCVNSGPAFLIGAISIPLTGNIICGIFLFISQVIAFFTVGTLCSIKAKPEKININNKTKLNISTTFVSSVTKSVKTMAIICGFTITFSVIIKFLFQVKFLNMQNNIITLALISGFFEVTNGITKFKEIYNLNTFLVITLIVAFGGLCVHCQLKAILADFKISFTQFYFWRIIYCLINLVVARILFSTTTITISTMAISNLKPQIVTNNVTTSVILIILSILLLYCDKNKFQNT